jgi:site-specific DNA recombinase
VDRPEAIEHRPVVCRRLKSQQIRSPRGKDYWDRSSVWGILKNPAYKGTAAFGKPRIGPMRPRLRGGRNRHEQPRNGQSPYDVPMDQWISVAVPAIVDESLFDAVARQLEENRARSRQGNRGACYLLQGIIVCNCCCKYAYYGKQISLVGGGHRVCQNKQVRQDLLGQAVWNDVRSLLSDPARVERELNRRRGEWVNVRFT